jgi:hypothetical protein
MLKLTKDDIDFYGKSAVKADIDLNMTKELEEIILALNGNPYAFNR